jgi:elongation factor G
MEPLERGSGIRFVNKVTGGKVPRDYFDAVEKGVYEAAETGVLGGYPMTDIGVTFYDGSFHEVDSSDMAFKMAAIFAFREGAQRARPILLEPIMKVEVIAPEEYLGDVLAQLNARRATIVGMEPRPGKIQEVNAQVPLVEMFGYATELRSATQGRGVFSMEFTFYSPMSETVQQKVLN